MKNTIKLVRSQSRNPKLRHVPKFETLGDYLRFSRIESGFSQWEISKFLGYSTSQFVSNWETGRSSPPLDALAKIRGPLGLSEETIVELILQDTEREVRNRLRPARVRARLR